MHADFLLGPARYASHLERWLEQFPRGQLHVILFDDIESKPAEVLRGMFVFLDVDPTFQPPSLLQTGSAVRQGTSPRSERARQWHSKMYRALVENAYTPLKRMLGTRKAARIKEALRIRPLMESLFMREGYPEMNAQIRARLAAEFAPEIERLEQLTALNLKSWKAR